MGGQASGGEDGLAWPPPGQQDDAPGAQTQGVQSWWTLRVSLSSGRRSTEPTQLRDLKYSVNTAEIYGRRFSADDWKRIRGGFYAISQGHRLVHRPVIYHRCCLPTSSSFLEV